MANPIDVPQPVCPNTRNPTGKPAELDEITALVPGICLAAVVLASIINLPLALACSALLAGVFGPDHRYTGGLMLVLLPAANLCFFGLVWLPIFLLTRRSSTKLQSSALIALTIAYVGFWSGLTIRMLAEMARTEDWL